MRGVEAELQPCAYRKNGFEYKELIDFYYKVEISPNKKNMMMIHLAIDF